MYDAVRSSRKFPEKEFDPKAVTRASWEPKSRKPQKKGPLISFGRHPEYVMPCPAVFFFYDSPPPLSPFLASELGFPGMLAGANSVYATVRTRSPRGDPPVSAP